MTSDIYSLGVLLYHLVTDSYPVTGRSRADVESAHLAAQRQSLRDARPDLSNAFIEVVERALARVPGDRYRSAGEFGNALASVAGGKYTDDPAPTAPRWRTVAMAATVAAALFVAFIMFDRKVAEAPGVITEGINSGQPPAVQPAPNMVPAVDSSYEVMASFYARRNGDDVRLTHGSRVRPGDALFAVIDASKPVFVYIINRDETGQSFLLFPLSGLSPANPCERSKRFGFQVREGVSSILASPQRRRPGALFLVRESDTAR